MPLGLHVASVTAGLRHKRHTLKGEWKSPLGSCDREPHSTSSSTPSSTSVMGHPTGSEWLLTYQLFQNQPLQSGYVVPKEPQQETQD